MVWCSSGGAFDFYPRSPCGERPRAANCQQRNHHISIHALLAESDVCSSSVCTSSTVISIHALLAESDIVKMSIKVFNTDFYPRSPCGERPGVLRNSQAKLQFLSTLSLRRATNQTNKRNLTRRFLSTLSLRRATVKTYRKKQGLTHFYPRSPCGERHNTRTYRVYCPAFLSTLSLRRATHELAPHSRC